MRNLLFLHGWGCDSSIWHNQISFFADTAVNTYAIDLPGFGKAPLTVSLTIYGYADYVARYIRANNLTDLTIVGHSFGGRIAILLASEFPELVRNIVLIDSAGLVNRSLTVKYKIAKYKATKWLVGKRIFDKKHLEKYGSADYRACSGVLRRTLNSVVNTDLAKFARRIVCPTLIIWGAKDTATPMSQGKRLHRLIRNSGLIVIPDGTHYSFLEYPSFVNMALQSFVVS